MEEYILRSKKSKHGRKWLARHKRTRKMAKVEKQQPPPPSLCSSTLQQRHHQKPIKGEVQVHPQHPIHLTSTIPPKSSSSTVQHTENLHFFHLSPYSSVATKTDRRLKQEHHEHHQELLQELQDGQGSKDLKAKLSLNHFILCHDNNITAFFYFLCHGKPSVTNSNLSPFPLAL
jgi:hypothetical protein